MVRRSGRLNPRAEGEVRREAEVPPINPEMDDSTNNDISDEDSEEGDSISDADSEDLSRLTKPQALEYIREISSAVIKPLSINTLKSTVSVSAS